MKKLDMIWAVLAVVFILSAVVLSFKPNTGELPFSSYSASDEGTKAAYLLLSELGFDVERKTVSMDEWSGSGFIIALGADYLAESGQDWIIENSTFFTNKGIRQNANDFLVMMFPYKEDTIVFDEYGRRQHPIQTASHLKEERPNSIWDIMPVHLRFICFSGCFLAFWIMFFYKQRVGEATIPEGFSGRSPIESVNAMADAMLKARVFKDCAAFYYKYQAGKNNEWDLQGSIDSSVKSVKTEREALLLISEIDKQLNECSHKFKR